MSRDDLIPQISERHLTLLKRIHGDGIAPIVHADGLPDIAFLDIEAMCRAGLLERLTMGRFKGYRVTNLGKDRIKNAKP
jgi:hypothetical protein